MWNNLFEILSSREKTIDLDKPMSAMRKSAIPVPIVHAPPAPDSNDANENEQEEEVEVDYDYDDDFEDYDDDFEDEEEEEEEENDAKVIRGNYESARLTREMAEVKAAMKRENSAANYEPPNRSKETFQSSQDDNEEGNNKPDPLITRKPSGKIAVNFASAKERQKTKMVAGKTKKRGDELLTMIRLDIAKIDLFDLPPIAYEALMNQTLNRVQATSQTGEDNLDEELQTDHIEKVNKWTQNPPPPVINLADDDMDAMLQTMHGVGKEKLINYS